MNKNDIYLTVSQAAEYLGCNKEDVKQLVEQGKLTPLKARPNDHRFVLSMRQVNRIKI